jgi:hypothetical protein
MGIRWMAPRPGPDVIPNKNVNMDVRKMEFDIMNRFELSQDMLIWCDFPLAVLNLRATIQHRISQTKQPSAHRIPC